MLTSIKIQEVLENLGFSMGNPTKNAFIFQASISHGQTLYSILVAADQSTFTNCRKSKEVPSFIWPGQTAQQLGQPPNLVAAVAT